ncbi:hypothetical protein RRG08_010532 [Elysia crispata]|uniref:Uncharacterized protein n=1 Tax=Elysia crispata TaxID=231223 RepID=A0AAE1E241_9GAST|nr:hypothetical protein RRG08_010532 [Elysia crispata]
MKGRRVLQKKPKAKVNNKSLCLLSHLDQRFSDLAVSSCLLVGVRADKARQPSLRAMLFIISCDFSIWFKTVYHSSQDNLTNTGRCQDCVAFISSIALLGVTVLDSITPPV